MVRLRNFLRLPNTERLLLVKVTSLLGVIWLGLRVLPFKSLYRVIGRFSQSQFPQIRHSDDGAGRICGAVNKVGRNFMGDNTCFPQALAGMALLKRSGYDAVLRIGVARDESKKSGLRAHAWVEMDGEVVIGGPMSLIETYTPLTDLEKVSF